MGFGFKKVETMVDAPPLGQAWRPSPYSGGAIPRHKALVKSGGGGAGWSLGQEGSGGSNDPLGCPKCMPWWLAPLAALGVMQAAAWILARK